MAEVTTYTRCDLGGDIGIDDLIEALRNPKYCRGVTTDPLTVKYGEAIEAAAAAAFEEGIEVPHWYVEMEGREPGDLVGVYITPYQEVPLIVSTPEEALSG